MYFNPIYELNYKNTNLNSKFGQFLVNILKMLIKLYLG